jgi:hypothetical protein
LTEKWETIGREILRKNVIAISLVATVVLGVFLYYAVPRISVSGTGTVSTVPDQAQISFTVREMDALAANAVSRQAAIMEKVLTALVTEGISKEEVTTSGYSLNPIYNYTDYGDPYYPIPTSGEIMGYEAVQSIQVTVSDLPRIGSLLDKIVQAGVKQIDYIGFSFKDATYASLRTEAYKKAVMDARGQADAIVGATGGFVIGIASLSTNYWGPIYVEERDVPSGVATSQTPVVPSGSITVTANVNIVYPCL